MRLNLFNIRTENKISGKRDRIQHHGRTQQMKKSGLTFDEFF